MTEALRVMTFNVQLLPLVAGVLEGRVAVPAAALGRFPRGDVDSRERASLVANDLVSIPDEERPHVIALNEVFNEDGRQVLRDALSPTYPHYVASIQEKDLEEDAGLMVVSRIPFSPLPGGALAARHFYSVDAGADSWASKGAVMVRLNTPAEVTTLVFTHLQAAYDAEDQYREVRAKQLVELVEWVDGLLGNDPANWRNLVIAGDLNVRGDPGMESDEWHDLFTRNPLISSRLVDSWVEMRPPGVSEDVDPGLTHRERPTGAQMRLDYFARARPAAGVDELVAHRVRIGHRNTSDHYAVEATLQLRDPHCQPCTATDLGTMKAIGANVEAGTPLTSNVYAVHMAIHRPGTHHWIYLPRAGTYSFFAGTGLTYQHVAADDLSQPLQPLAELSTEDLPPRLHVPFVEFAGQVATNGRTHATRSGSFVAVRDAAGAPNTGVFIIVEHLGDSPGTAIHLPAHHQVRVPFPAAQRLGDSDTAWFRISPRRTLIGTPRTETVRLEVPAKLSASLELLDLSQAPARPMASGERELVQTVDVDADASWYVRVGRSSIDDVGHLIIWDTPVTHLRLDRPVVLHVSDETSTDWSGADEPELSLTIDGVAFLEARWGDADAGEDWPGLASLLATTAKERGAENPRVIAFDDRIGIVLEEPDNPPFAHGEVVYDVKALAAGEPPVKGRKTAIKVFDAYSDGLYSFSCTLSRDP